MDRYTPTALQRWSILPGDLPAVSSVKEVHVYDFDNTLFLTPVPNIKLWSRDTLSRLQSPSPFFSGGWWHDPRVLSATGKGEISEAATQWKGHWNERVVTLIKLSREEPQTISILLTGRAEKGFSEIITKMITAKGLKFDMVCLKPELGPEQNSFSSTLKFKEQLLRSVLNTYREFQLFLNTFTPSNPSRSRIHSAVIHVQNPLRTLDPVMEVMIVQRMMTDHHRTLTSATAGVNQYHEHEEKRQRLHHSVVSTGWQINAEGTTQLFSLLPKDLQIREGQFECLSSTRGTIPLSNGAPGDVAPLGSRANFQVTHIGHSKSIWAVKMRPVGESVGKVYLPGCDSEGIMLVALTRKAIRWKPDFATVKSWKQLEGRDRFVFILEVANREFLSIIRESGNGITEGRDHGHGKALGADNFTGTGRLGEEKPAPIDGGDDGRRDGHQNPAEQREYSGGGARVGSAHFKWGRQNSQRGRGSGVGPANDAGREGGHDRGAGKLRVKRGGYGPKGDISGEVGHKSGKGKGRGTT